MDHLSARQVRFLNITGRLYAFAFYTTYKRFLGWSLSGWLHLAPLVAALVFALQRRFMAAVLALLFFVALRIFYWAIRRRGYKSFVPDPADHLPPETEPVPDNEHIAIRATGIFAVTDQEAYLLERSPTEYWRAPLGDHIMMARHGKSRFLYQFFKGNTLVDVTSGWLIAAGRTSRALAIRFYVTWGPEFTDDSLLYIVGGGHKEKRGAVRTLYFSFTDETVRYRVWATLETDLDRARDGEVVSG